MGGGAKRTKQRIEESGDTMMRVAIVLQHAAMHGEKAAAAEYGYSTQTVRRWKAAFRTHEKVRAFVALHRKALSEECNRKASEGLMAAADFIVRCATGTDQSPEMLRAVNDGARTLAQYLTLDKAIEGRLSGIDVFGNGSPSSLPAPHSVDAELVVDESESDPSTEADAPADEGP